MEQMEQITNSNDRVRDRVVDKVLISKLFDKLAAVYGHIWSSRHKSAQEWESALSTWLDALKDFDYPTIRDALTDALGKYVDYPPTLAQLVKLCLNSRGIPSCDACVIKAVRRDFDHPLVLMVYKGVGSFVFKTAKAHDLALAAQKIYEDLLTRYLQNPVQEQKNLNVYLDERKQLIQDRAKEISKSSQDIDLAKLNKWLAAPRYDDLTKANEISKLKHPVWDPSECNPMSKKYSAEVYKSRHDYLTKLDDDSAITLNRHDSYDRMRYLSQIEAMAAISDKGSHYPTGSMLKTPTKAFKSKIKNIRDYMDRD